MWFYQDDSCVTGPLDLPGMRELASQGKIGQKTLVWREGLSRWQPAEQTELASLFRPSQLVATGARRDIDGDDLRRRELGEIQSSTAGRDSPGEPPPRPPGSTYRDLGSLSTAAIVLLAGCAVAEVLVAGGAWSDYRLLADFWYGNVASEQEAWARLDAADLRAGLVGLLSFGVSLATVVVFLRWKYLASLNVRALGARRLRYTPAWAVGAYFIPIFWFWWPYQAMREIANASIHPSAWHERPAHPLIKWWWGLWIVSEIVSWQIGSAASSIEIPERPIWEEPELVDELMEIAALDMLTAPLHIASAILACLVVRHVARCQEQTAKSNGRSRPGTSS